MDILQQFVRDNQVKWEVRPIVEIVGGEKVSVGYELEISAASNGIAASPALFRDLTAVAQSVLPRELDATRVEVLPFDHSVRLDPHDRLRPRVLLKLRIIHATGYFQAATSDQTKCLREVEQALRSLGVTKRTREL